MSNYESRARKWLEESNWGEMSLKDAVLAFARELDEDGLGYHEHSHTHCFDSKDLDDGVHHARHLKCCLCPKVAPQPSQECAYGPFPCEKCVPKPKPCEHVESGTCNNCLLHRNPQPVAVEELDDFDRDWHNDPENDYRHTAAKLDDVIRKLNELVRRFNERIANERK